MKLIIFAFAVLFIGAVAAQTAATPTQNSRVLMESLVKRAEAAVQLVQTTLNENHGQFGFLLQSLGRHGVLIQVWTLDLKAQLDNRAQVSQQHPIHVIEDEILYLEKRILDEIAIINHVKSGGDRRGENGAALVARGQRLVEDGQVAVAAHPQAREKGDIQAEIMHVESLIKAIQAKAAPTAAELQKDEDDMALHERTVRQLIESANGGRN